MKLGNPQERFLTEISWLAGVWESEGWFSLNYEKKRRGNQFVIKCGFTNTDFIFIEEVIKILQNLDVAFHVSKKRKSGLGNKPKKEINIVGLKRSKKFLIKILPFLKTSKKERAKLLLQFIVYRERLKPKVPYGNLEYVIWDKLRTLNSYQLKKSPESLRKKYSDYDIKMDSELQGKLAELAEMTSRLSLGNNCLN